MFIIFYFFTSLLCFFVFFSIIINTLRYGISPMPSSRKAKKAILQLLHDNLPKKLDGNVVELGSGFSTLAIPIANCFPENNMIAYEISLIPFSLSKMFQFFIPQKNLIILRKDFFDVDLNNSKLIICYLYPAAMEKLKVKLENELKNETYLISNTFAIPGWKPISTITLDDLYKTKIYLYKYMR